MLIVNYAECRKQAVMLIVVMLKVVVPLKQLVLNTSAYFSGASEEKEMFCNIATGPVSFRITPIHV